MPAIDETLSAVTDVLADGLTSFTELKSSIGGIDLTPVLTVLLPIALLVLGLMVLSSVVQISVSTSRSLKGSGLLPKLQDAWQMREEFGYSKLLASRQMRSFLPIVNGIELLAEKYNAHKDD